MHNDVVGVDVSMDWIDVFDPQGVSGQFPSTKRDLSRLSRRWARRWARRGALVVFEGEPG